MDKELKKLTIETIRKNLLDKIKQYHQTRSVTHLTIDDRNTMRQVWKTINPTSYFNDSCATCMKTVLDITESWYGRESAREQQSMITTQPNNESEKTEVVIEPASVDEIKTIEIKPKKIIKKKKTNAKKNKRSNKSIHNSANNKALK